MNPPANFELAQMHQDIQCVHTFLPVFRALEERGLAVDTSAKGEFTSALVFCHRSKGATLNLLAKALDHVRPGGMIAVEGAKTDGVESIIKAMRQHFANMDSFSKAHGKVAWAPFGERPDLAAWKSQVKTLEGGFATRDGMFSADNVDKGSALLVNHLPALMGRVGDLGAGWGYLSKHILSSDAVTHLDIIEAEHTALEAARQNVTDTRASFHWADATRFAGASYNSVVTNPPFHVGRKPDPALGQAFIKRAAQLLMPKGDFWMVANRNLPYEDTLTAAFSKVNTVTQSDGFKVIHASHPNRDFRRS